MLLHELLAERDADAGVFGDERDVRPGCVENDGGGFGIPADVEAHARGVEDLRGELVGVLGVGREGSAHEDELVGEVGEVVVEPRGEREVGDGARGRGW